ncbi:ankyrin [Daedalea quercina L-15889]|uniref:Ankyrin n=1 Tax=Daedalea quercina L-15889 TaxID=1314783 RepID=A0A165MYG4_9APHY|nr:ankyrin [Daedalea quercina L-15889]
MIRGTGVYVSRSVHSINSTSDRVSGSPPSEMCHLPGQRSYDGWELNKKSFMRPKTLEWCMIASCRERHHVRCSSKIHTDPVSSSVSCNRGGIRGYSHRSERDCITTASSSQEALEMAAANGGSLPTETVEFAHRMFDAARTGDTALLSQAIDAGLPANLTNEKGNTLLMLAAYSGHAGLAGTLLSKGADPNRINDNGQSPLAGAVFKNEVEAIRVLMAGGANPRLGTPTAIQTARIFKRDDILEVLGATEEDLKEALPTVPGPPH